VVGGHRDRLKVELVHISSTVRHSDIRLVLALASILGLKVWTAIVRQAYLQAATPLLRDVYVQTDSLHLNKGEILRLLTPLYGLSDSGDYWARALSNFHLER
jgi:hypothetical protein